MQVIEMVKSFGVMTGLSLGACIPAKFEVRIFNYFGAISI